MRNKWIGAVILLLIVGYIVLYTAAVTTAVVQKQYEPKPTPTPAAKSVVNMSYHYFMDNSEAGFMQIVTIPDVFDMHLNDYGYMEFDMDMPLTGHAHTYAISGLATDARTNVGCYEAWYWNTPPTTQEGYGLAFCISDNDMLWLFNHGAYSLSYNEY